MRIVVYIHIGYQAGASQTKATSEKIKYKGKKDSGFFLMKAKHALLYDSKEKGEEEWVGQIAYPNEVFGTGM